MKKLRNMRNMLGCIVGLAFGLVGGARAEVVQWQAPDLDRWMYSNNQTPGERTLAPIYGAVGDGDDRLGQVLVGYDTAGRGIPTGLGAAAYQVNSLTISFMSQTGGFLYDPTYDAFQTYLSTSGVADSDAGRPIELYGVGFTAPYTRFAFGTGGADAFREDSPYSVGGVRSAFAVDLATGGPRDVTNNVDGLNGGLNGFETTPFAVATTTDAAPGGVVPNFALFTFQVDLSDAGVRGYVQQGLDLGWLGFTLSTLMSSDFPFPSPLPQVVMRENFGAGLRYVAMDLDWQEATAGVPGDVTGDGLVNAADIDALFDLVGQASATFDFDQSGVVDAADVDHLITEILGTFRGDANLDRAVSLGDLALLAESYGKSPRGWSQGDFSGDGVVSLGDLALLAENYGRSNQGAGLTAAAVPVPGALGAGGVMLIGLAAGARCRSRRRQGGMD